MYFVEDDERIFRRYFLHGKNLEVADDFLGLELAVENFAEARGVLKIEVGRGRVAASAEFERGIGFADLARAVEYAIAVKSRVFTDPVLKGSYPGLVKELGFRFPVEKGDMEDISQPIDFIGINYYSEDAVTYSEDELFRYKVCPDWHPVSDMGWPVVPDGLARLLKWISNESGNLPLYITENGAAEPDVVSPDGRVHDADRIDYLRKHFKAVSRVIAEGVNLKGYYIWSFIDNFEWAKGYSKRFGIVYCDYATLERIPKDSAYFVKDVIGGLCDWT